MTASQGFVEARIYVTLALAFLIFISLSSIIAIADQLAFYSHTSPTPLGFQLDREDLPMFSRLGMFSPLYLFPVASTGLALAVELYCLRPLRRNIVPKRGIFLVITMLGYIFGAVLVGILLTIAYRKIYGKRV